MPGRSRATTVRERVERVRAGGSVVRRKAAFAVSLSLCVALVPGVGQAGSDHSGGGRRFEPGAAGLGDPYFPLDGNGGYDVKHYLLDVTYDPATDVLSGEATIEARSTQNLSSFNFDFEMTVRAITATDAQTWIATVVSDGRPRRGLEKHKKFTTVGARRNPSTIEDQSSARPLLPPDRCAISSASQTLCDMVPSQHHPRQGVHFRSRAVGVERSQRLPRAPRAAPWTRGRDSGTWRRTSKDGDRGVRRARYGTTHSLGRNRP